MIIQVAVYESNKPPNNGKCWPRTDEAHRKYQYRPAPFHINQGRENVLWIFFCFGWWGEINLLSKTVRVNLMPLSKSIIFFVCYIVVATVMGFVSMYMPRRVMLWVHMNLYCRFEFQLTCRYRRRRLATFPWTTLQSPCLKTTRFRTRRDENLVCRYLLAKQKKKNPIDFFGYNKY